MVGQDTSFEPFAMTNRSTAWFLCILICVIGVSADAGITLTVGNPVEAVGGGTAFVPISATSDSGDMITGYNIPIDLGNIVGFGIESGFALNTTPDMLTGDLEIQNSVFAATSAWSPSSGSGSVGALVEGIATGDGAAVSLSASPTKLFDVVVEYDNTVPLGTLIFVNIIDPPVPGTLNVTGGTIDTIQNGSISVPEPARGILAFCFVSFSGTAWLRRRRLRHANDLSFLS